MTLVSRRMATNALSPAQMNELGRNVIASGDLDQAADIFELLVGAEMAEASTVLALGVSLHAAGRTREALEWTGRAVSLDPEDPLGFHVLAHLFIEIEAFSAGEDAARQALRLRPEFSTARAQLGHCLQKLGRPQEAVTELSRALEQAPNDVSARLDLGNAFQDLGEWKEAEKAFILAAQYDPQSSKTHFNLGNLFQKWGRRSEALAAYDRALEITPEDAAVRVNAALLQLTMEDFERGWANFEWRWKAPSERPIVRECVAPIWRGDESISGKRLLIQSEQGLGDTLQFIRYAAPLARLGAEVLVDAPASLQTLLKTAEGVVRVITPREVLPTVDFRCPMMSLPHALRMPTPLASPPEGYLTAHPDAQRTWDDRLGEYGQPMVGLAYAGNPRHTNDCNRSLPLGELLARLPKGPCYMVLQTELRDGDADLLASRDDIEWLGSDFKDFMDTAAATGRLDLILTVDTAMAHLAGALGRPTHLLLPFEPDWRWGYDRSSCLWYPSMTVHRQARPGDWSHPLADVSEILAGLVAPQRGQA